MEPDLIKDKEKRVIISVELFNTILHVVILALLLSFISAQMIFNYVIYKQSETRLDYALIGAIIGNPTAQQFLDIRKEKAPMRGSKNGNGKN